MGAAVAAVSAAVLTVAPALAKPTDAAPNTARIGERAPNFTLKDTTGAEHTLADLTGEGKIVVLQWFNADCPVVQGHYEGKNTFNDLYAKYHPKDVEFLAINSGAAGNQGHGKDAEAAKKWKIEYPILSDETGAVGKAYGAKATPHMYIIDTKGTLRYMGAIDNNARGDKSGSAYVNYVAQALDEILAGETVSTPETRAYGCNVKYKN